MTNEEVAWEPLDLIMRRLHAFLDGMEVVLDVADFVNENRRELDSVESAIVRQGLKMYPGIPKEKHRQFADMLHPEVHRRMHRQKELEDGGASTEEVDAFVQEWAAQLRQKFFEISGDADDYYRYEPVWGRARRAFRRTSLLGNSLLMTAVSDFEVLVSGVVRATLQTRPEILRASGQTYSISDLEPFADLDEFRAHAREVMAEGLLRGGFDDWMGWFRKQGILADGVTDNAESIVEVFQRRHLLAHNGGIVNKFYLAKVKSEISPALGEKLGVDRPYLLRSVDEMTVVAFKLSVAVLLKFAPDDSARRDVSHSLAHMTYDLLAAGRWGLAATLNEWHLEFAEGESNRLLAMINRWTAQKKLNGLDSVRTEVEAWDTNTLAGRFRLAKLALLDQHEEAYSVAKALIASNELSLHNWRSWPMLEELRAHEVQTVAAGDRLSKGVFGDEHADGE